MYSHWLLMRYANWSHKGNFKNFWTSRETKVYLLWQMLMSWEINSITIHLETKLGVKETYIYSIFPIYCISESMLYLINASAFRGLNVNTVALFSNLTLSWSVMPAAGVLRLPRLLVVVWGLLLRHFLLLVEVSGVEVVPWYMVKVSQDTLQVQTPTELPCSSNIQCAVLASQDPESQHLFCLSDPNTCRIYDLQIPSERDESAKGPVQNCWTKHPAGKSEWMNFFS